MPGQHDTQHAPTATAGSVTRPWADVALAVVVSAIAAWAWIEASAFPETDDPARNPAVLPQVIAVVLWLCALAIVLSLALRRIRGTPSKERDDVSSEPAPPASVEPDSESGVSSRHLGGVVVFVAALMIYIWAAFEATYLVATWLFLTAATCALGGRPRIRSVAVAAVVSGVCAVVIWLGFVYALGVHLPQTWAP